MLSATVDSLGRFRITGARPGTYDVVELVVLPRAPHPLEPADVARVASFI